MIYPLTMAKDAYFLFDDDNNVKYKYSHNHKTELVNLKHEFIFIA